MIEKFVTFFFSVLTTLNIIATSTPTPIPKEVINENILWNKINKWQTDQNYQSYIKDDKLCNLAKQRIAELKINWSNKDFEQLKKSLNYNVLAENSSRDFNSEESILNSWLNNAITKKNLTDYFKYSCIKCSKSYCVQIFGNKNNQVIQNSFQQNSSNEEWGKIKQTGEVTYESKFNSDLRMATPNEIFIAVNDYRAKNGKGSVGWDNGLSSWAQSRASFFASNDLDSHAGFNAEIESKAKELGLKGAGEDSFIGGALEAVHLIEWTFAQDEPHKAILLGNYNTLGIGVASGSFGYGVDLIFGNK